MLVVSEKQASEQSFFAMIAIFSKVLGHQLNLKWEMAKLSNF